LCQNTKNNKREVAKQVDYTYLNGIRQNHWKNGERVVENIEERKRDEGFVCIQDMVW